MTISLRADGAGTYGAVQLNGVDKLLLNADSTLSGAATPAQFDDSFKLATTAFVQRAIGGYQDGVFVSTAGQTLTPAQVNCFVNLNSTASNVTLPLLSSVPVGSVLYFRSSLTSTINRQGSDVIYASSSLTTETSIVIGANSNITLINDGTKWFVAGNVSLKYDTTLFGASLGTSGYQKLPSGLIMQWGLVGATCTTTVTATQGTLPIAFPNGGFFAVGSRTVDLNTSNSPSFGEFFSVPSTTQVQVTHVRSSGSVATSWRYLAFGY